MGSSEDKGCYVFTKAPTNGNGQPTDGAGLYEPVLSGQQEWEITVCVGCSCVIAFESLRIFTFFSE